MIQYQVPLWQIFLAAAVYWTAWMVVLCMVARIYEQREWVREGRG